jgi:hypothetical protein
MEKRVEPLSVDTTTEDFIEISQPDALAEDAERIVLHPAQVPTLVKWLEEAKAELEANAQRVAVGCGRQSPTRTVGRAAAW